MSVDQEVTGNGNVQVANVRRSTITVAYENRRVDLPLRQAKLDLPDGPVSPSLLLRPRYGVVPFDDYTGLAKKLEDWCATPGNAFEVRLVAGAGGAGKTRLAVELCHRLESRQWTAGLLRLPSPAFPLDSGQLDALGALPTARLVVIDYAETLAPELEDLLPRISAQSSARTPTRVLLLTRSRAPTAGEALARFLTAIGHNDWLHVHLTEQGVSFLADGHPNDEGLQWRERLFHASRGAFLERLHLDGQARVGGFDLSQPVFSRPLMVAIAAFLDAASDPVRSPARSPTGKELLDDLLAHEDHYWAGVLRGGEDRTLRTRVVALATLFGASDENAGARVLTLVPDLAESSEERRHNLARRVHDLYPGERYWNPLEPDLVAEFLMASTCGYAPAILSAALGDRAAQDIVPTVQLLARACRDDHRLTQTVGKVLCERVLPLTELAVKQAHTISDEHPENESDEYAPLGVALASLVRATRPNGNGVKEALGLLPSVHRDLTDLRIALGETRVHELERDPQLGPDHPETIAARANLAVSYHAAGHKAAAVTLFESVVADRERLLGPEHPDTIAARANLAVSYHAAGRTAEAITIGEQVVSDRERLLGAEHPDTIAARANLAASYDAAGRTAKASALLEKVVSDCEHLLGPEHPDTVAARGMLAASYGSGGRMAAAITMRERVVSDCERLFGPEHPDTVTARTALAASYQSAGRTTEAITIGEQVVSERERLLGTEHPDTITARAVLAASYGSAGRTTEAITIGEQVVSDRERLLGAEHPDTIAARGDLAVSYGSAGRTTEAIMIGEQVVSDRERLLGAEHPDTITARANLAASYGAAGRTTEAVTLMKQVLADRERILGSDHPATLMARANLATSYGAAGRTTEAMTIGNQVLVHLERLFGSDHPDTITARANLAASYGAAGRTTEAVTLFESVLADRERILGSDHPATLMARVNLVTSYRSAGRTDEAIALEQ